MKAFIPVVWPRVQSASSAAGVFLSTIFPYRSAFGGWGVREEAAGLRRGERFAGERRPEIGEGFPEIGELFPVLGEPFPQMGRLFPENRGTLPRFRATLPQLPRSAPRLPGIAG